MPGIRRNKDTDNTKVIFVDIGVPFSDIPIIVRAFIFVDLEKQTTSAAAIEYRKQVANNIENHGWVKGTSFAPEELYYEIYNNRTDEMPVAMSWNSRWRIKNINGLPIV